MTTQLLLVTALTSLLLTTVAQAQVSKETLACQNYIKKASERFVDKVADAIEKCLLAVQKCNLDSQADPAGCKAKLLVENKGACAVGKLSSDLSYFGGGSSANHDPNSKAVIDREFGKFKAKLANCDLNNIDFSELNLPVPADFDAFVDSLNGNPSGAACLGHKRVKVTLPNRDSLFSDLISQPDANNVPNGFGAALFFPGNLCK